MHLEEDLALVESPIENVAPVVGNSRANAGFDQFLDLDNDILIRWIVGKAFIFSQRSQA